MADKKNPPTQPSLIGRKVYLRPLTADDVLAVHRWRLQSELQSLSCHAIVFRTPEEASEAYQKREPAADTQRFAIVRLKDDTLVGMVSYFSYNDLNRSAELGLIVDPDERRHGFGKEGLRLLAGYLFQYRGLNKVHAQTAAFNKPTAKLLEKSGFKLDATLRDHYFYEEEYHAGLIYSLLSFEFD